MPEIYIICHQVKTQYMFQCRTVLQLFYSGILTASYSGEQSRETTSVQQICLVNWKKSSEFGGCYRTKAAQHSVNGSETRSAEFVNTAILSFHSERDQKHLSVASRRDTLWSCYIENEWHKDIILVWRIFWKRNRRIDIQIEVHL